LFEFYLLITGYEDECVPILKQCLNDFYRDLIERFRQHLELVDSSRNFQVIEIMVRTKFNFVFFFFF